MRKILLLASFLVLAMPALGQTSKNGRIVEGPLAQRPATCQPGDYYVSQDQNPVVEYKCSTGNVWNAEASGGGGGSPSAGTNGTVQCGDGAGNFVACHVNDNVTFPGALFVNENQIVSGALTVSGNGAAGNVPIKPNAGPIIYVATWGNDSNDGLSWGTAKQTIYAAWNLLPTTGCNFGPTCGGTIYISDNVTWGGPVSGQGLRIMGVHDPNYASPPSGWLTDRGASIICAGTGSWDTNSAAPSCNISGESNTQPAVWISGNTAPMEFDGLHTKNGSGSLLAVDSNGVRENSAAVTNITFRNSTFTESASSSTNGPGLLIGPNSFEVYFYDSQFDGNPTAANSTEQRQALVIDPGSTSNNNSGTIYVINGHMNGGAYYINDDAQGASGVYVDGVVCEGQTDGQGCIWIPVTNVNSGYTIRNVITADALPLNVAVEVDGNGPPDAVTVDGVNGATGPLTLRGLAPAGINGLVVSPDRQHQQGVMNGHLLGQTDAARRGFSPVSVRYANLANTAPSGWTVSGATVTTGIAAPDGTTGAGTCSGTGVCYFYNSAQTIAVGDIFVIGGWAQAKNAAGFAGSKAFGFSIQSCGGCTFADISGAGGNSTGFINQFMLGDGSSGAPSAEWEFYTRVFKVTSGSGASNPQFTYTSDATHPANFYGPMLLHIPANAISDNEAVEVGLNLQPYLNTCTVTQLCNVAGVVTGGGGLPSGTQGAALVNNNGANGYQTTPAYLDCSAFTAADWGLIAQSCLTALNALNSQSGIADMRGVSGGTTASVNPMGGTMPASGTMLLGPGSYLTNVSFVKHSDWSVQGVSVRGVDGQVGTTIKAGASFQGTYTTGTITVGTPGANEVITGSGTTWTASMKGCNFYGANGGANSTFGIIAAVGGTTSLTLGWGQNLGTGAAGGSAYTIACGVGVDGSGGSSSAGDQFGMWDTNINYDCNNVAGAMGLVNWFGNQGTGATNLGIHNCNNIGLDLENQIQNSGPWNNVTISAGSGCSASTLLLVVHGNQNPFKGINGLNLSRGACATSPAVGGDIDENGTVISGADIASVGIGLLFGANTTCPVVCAMPGRSTSGWEVDNLYAESTVTTAVENSNAFSTNSGWQIRNIVNTGTNALIDLVNSCTDTSSRLANYVTNSAGAIAVSTSSVSTCKTWNIPALVAAAITDSALTAGQSVCAGTGGLLATSGCPPVTLANRVVSGTTATDTILAGDCFNRVTYQTSVNVAVTLPTPTTLGIAGCALRLVNATTGASTAITVTPTTLTIGPGATSSWVIQKGQFSTLTVDGTNWDTDNTFASTTNCASSASPAVCGAAAYGSVAIPTGAGSSTLTINTTAVTANSVIMFYPDDTLGTKLGVTCNSTLATLVGGSAVTARTAGTSFQITFNGTIATNPVCGNYEIVN